MDGTINLTQAEACEAVRAYLQLRGALPAHGVVAKVSRSDAYGSAIEADVSIGEPPAPSPASPTPDAADAGMGA